MLIRSGASLGIVGGEPCRELQALFGAGVREGAAGDSPRCAIDLSPEDFPGRWNRRRAIAPELTPLPRVTAGALEAAGWWRRGSGAACRGGLVVANDTAPVLASLDFTREVQAAPEGLVRPAGFLQALPSTAASVLGLLFGLTDYQACVVNGALSGVEALRHALDLLVLERLDRVLVASLSVLAGERDSESFHPRTPRVRLAVAFCLESGAAGAPDDAAGPVAGASPGPVLDCGIHARREPVGGGARSREGEAAGRVARELPPEAFALASLPLLVVAKSAEKWFSGADPVPLVHHHEEPLTGGQAWITLR